jgi:hypothetical protein
LWEHSQCFHAYSSLPRRGYPGCTGLVTEDELRRTGGRPARKLKATKKPKQSLTLGRKSREWGVRREDMAGLQEQVPDLGVEDSWGEEN